MNKYCYRPKHAFNPLFNHGIQDKECLDQGGAGAAPSPTSSEEFKAFIKYQNERAAYFRNCGDPEPYETYLNSTHSKAYSNSSFEDPCIPNANQQSTQVGTDFVQNNTFRVSRCNPCRNKNTGRPKCGDTVLKRFLGGRRGKCGDPRPGRRCCNDPCFVCLCQFEGMRGCKRCKYLHCKCGLCRNCIMYAYVKTISDYVPQGTSQPQWNNCPQQYDGCFESQMDEGQKEAENGGPLISEYRAQFKCYRIKKQGRSSRKFGDNKVGAKVETGPSQPQQPWNSSVKVNSSKLTTSLDADEAKLKELDRLIQVDEPSGFFGPQKDRGEKVEAAQKQENKKETSK